MLVINDEYHDADGDNDDDNNSIKFFIYLRVELNSQWPITEPARIQTTTVMIQQKKKRTKNKKSVSVWNLT
jgi:hypothetical protein